jgi:hypothetical protein
MRCFLHGSDVARFVGISGRLYCWPTLMGERVFTIPYAATAKGRSILKAYSKAARRA